MPIPLPLSYRPSDRAHWSALRALSSALMLFLAASLSARVLSNEQRECIAAVIVLEAGGEPVVVMQGVFNVIAARAAHDPAQLLPTILKPRQFDVVSELAGQENPDWAAVLARARAHPKFPVALQIVVRWEANELDDVTDGCKYFLTVGTRRVWTQALQMGPTLGGLQFYRDPV